MLVVFACIVPTSNYVVAAVQYLESTKSTKFRRDVSCKRGGKHGSVLRVREVHGLPGAEATPSLLGTAQTCVRTE